MIPRRRDDGSSGEALDAKESARAMMKCDRSLFMVGYSVTISQISDSAKLNDSTNGRCRGQVNAFTGKGEEIVRRL